MNQPTIKEILASAVHQIYTNHGVILETVHFSVSVNPQSFDESPGIRYVEINFEGKAVR